MYDNTQSWISERGLGPDDTVRLYRGISTGGGRVDEHAMFKQAEGGNMPYNGNAIESWSISKAVARNFVEQGGGIGAVVVADVPVRNIISTARTGFGCISEGEMVIFGNIPGSQVLVDQVHGDLIPDADVP